jgi:hypothetical protein
VPTKPIRVSPPQWDAKSFTVAYSFVASLEKTGHSVRTAVTVTKSDGTEVGSFEKTIDLKAAGPLTDDGTGGRQPRAPGLLALEWSADDGYTPGVYAVGISSVLITPGDQEANGTLVGSVNTSLTVT